MRPLTVLACLWASQAVGQGANCGPHFAVVEVLKQTHREIEIGAGLSVRGIVSVWASDDGSFTVLRTAPNGVACILEHGRRWSSYPPEPEAEGEDG